MKKLTDGVLWTYCRDGNIEAFGELYERFYRLMYNYGCKLAQDTSTVHDVIQDLFVSLIANHKQISKAHNYPSGYLLTALRNRLYNQAKTSKIHFSISGLENQLEMTESSLTEEPSEYKNALIASYKKLSSDQQEIIYLYYIQNLSHIEISKILGINYQSSKNRLFRAVTILRKKALSATIKKV